VKEQRDLCRSATDDCQGLMVLSPVFDDAWQRKGAHYDDLAAAKARAALATILPHLAKLNIVYGDRLRNSALVLM